MEEILELKSADDWQKAWPVLRQLRSNLTEKDFLNRREQLRADGYRLFGLTVNGEIVSVASAHIYPHVSCGRNCWVHDMVTLDGERSNGYGQKLMRFVETWAKNEGCSRLSVHTRLERTAAQRFYEIKLGYNKTAVTFYQDLQADPQLPYGFFCPIRFLIRRLIFSSSTPVANSRRALFGHELTCSTSLSDIIGSLIKVQNSYRFETLFASK